MDIITCCITGKKFSKLRGFCNHLRGLGITTRQYYDKYIKSIDEGICVCGKPTSWASWGYNKWCSNMCPLLKDIRIESVKSRFQGLVGEDKKRQAIEKRGYVDPNISKRRETIATKCQDKGISINEYYSNHSKHNAASMTKQQREERTLKRMRTVTNTGRLGGRSYYKLYTLFGEQVIVQGYEPRILDYLQTTTNRSELMVANGKKIQPIKYNSVSGTRMYFPDMVLKHFIVEVKSDYTFQQHRANVFEKIGGVFDSYQNIILVIPSRTEVRKNILDGTKTLLDWAISSQASKDASNQPFVAVYDEGSTTILIGVESNDSKCRGSSRILEERDIVWSPMKIGAAIEAEVI